jgi:O-antigen ligase
MSQFRTLLPLFHFELEQIGGVLAALTLFSGATEVTLYLVARIPPILGYPFFAAASLWMAVALLRLTPKLKISAASLGALGAWMIYAAWAVTTSAWSISPAVIGGKLLAFLGISLAFLFIGIYVGSTKPAFTGFRSAILVMGMSTALAVASIGIGPTARLVRNAPQLIALQTSYQATTTQIAVAAIVAIAYALSPGTNTMRRQFFGGLGVIYLIATLAGGGRAAAIGMVVALPALLAVMSLSLGRLPGTTRMLPAIGATIVGAAAIVIVGFQLQLRSLQRFSRIFNSLQDSSGRLDLWSHGLTLASAHPIFGGGFASFHGITTIEDAGHYPHNVFLEAVAETGLIGLSLLVGAIALSIVVVLRRIRRLDTIDALVWSGLLVLTLVSANFTGTVTDRFLTFSVGLGIGLCIRADSTATTPGGEFVALTRPATE